MHELCLKWNKVFYKKGEKRKKKEMRCWKKKSIVFLFFLDCLRTNADDKDNPIVLLFIIKIETNIT